MKTYKLLSISTLLALTVSCNLDKNNKNFNFSVDNSNIKTAYKPNESVDFKILNPDNAQVDSVVYYFNDTKLATKNALENTKVELKDLPLGYSYFKALVYSGGVETQVSSRIEIFSPSQPKILNYTLLNTYPHDSKAYTQGLEFYGDILIESTGNGEGPSGLRGKSSIRRVNPKTGEVLKIVELTDNIFGEGATVLNDKIYQLTWTTLEGYVYDVNTLERLETFSYFGKVQGWGLTNDGTSLIMSDGSEKLYFVDPVSKKKTNEIRIYTDKAKIETINEMEYVNGKIYANLYTSDSVIIIDPKTGAVEAVLDLSDLKTKVTKHQDLDVLNGIAYNKKTNTFYVTGKNWDKMFEIKISE